MIVADASVLFAAVLERARTGDIARDWLGRHEVHVPELADMEVIEAARGWLLRHRLTVEQATSAVGSLAALPVIRHSHATLLPRVWSLRDNVTSYDASYVALAEQLDVALVTADRRVSRASGPRCKIEVLH